MHYKDTTMASEEPTDVPPKDLVCEPQPTKLVKRDHRLHQPELKDFPFPSPSLSPNPVLAEPEDEVDEVKQGLTLQTTHAFLPSVDSQATGQASGGGGEKH